ncbi:MAG: hypothetical protein WCW84_09395 [Sulfurimonas sp.]|jgi:hypothetical protein
MKNKHFLQLGILCLMLASSYAVEAKISAFGTLGGAVSDNKYTYQRFITDEGTLNRDSLFGAQTDISFNDEWSATIQGKVAPSDDSDNRWSPTLTWAFLSYRPTNDWLIRAGKIRMPLYLNSQNMDVGVTYDMARLPQEVYSLSPANDGLGAIVTKSFELENGELSFDLFYAKANDKAYRFYTRDDLSMYGGYAKGVNFQKLDFETTGLTINYETDENDKFRFGVYSAKVTKDGTGTAGNFTLQMASPTSPLYGYPYPFYQPDGALDKSEAIAFTVGMDYGLGDGYRLTSELAMRNMIGADTGPNAKSGYISVSKKIDKWTPYITVATLRAENNVKNLYNNLDSDPINNVIPVNRQYSDMVVVSEQNSYTVGTSYSIAPLQKIKAEWMHVDVGSYSNFLIDNPNTERMGKQTINVYSLSYNVSF